MIFWKTATNSRSNFYCYCFFLAHFDSFFVSGEDNYLGQNSQFELEFMSEKLGATVMDKILSDDSWYAAQ